jgi:hypothetical protein
MLRLPPVYLLLGLGLLTLIVYFRATVSTGIKGFGTSNLTPANSTLGFGALYVVSGPNSPRRDGLIQAANVTELDFTIPDLPTWTDEQIAIFRNHDTQSTITNGSVRAWLSHNVVLNEFLKSGQETALILEDDVDWDIRLRTVQAPLAAAGARSILPPAEESYYWGHPADWELMYVGHCGDYFTTLDEDIGVGPSRGPGRDPPRFCRRRHDSREDKHPPLHGLFIHRPRCARQNPRGAQVHVTSVHVWLRRHARIC